MPFIDDDLLWCPDNDGKMVDLNQCLQVSAFHQAHIFLNLSLLQDKSLMIFFSFFL